MISSAFKDRTLMITGGTGSFGSTVLKHFLESEIGEIRIFSRDEKSRTTCAIDYSWRIRSLLARFVFILGMFGIHDQCAMR